MTHPSSTHGRRPRHVLLVEDDAHDADLVRTAFDQVDVDHVLHVVADGARAIDFLDQRGREASAPRPDLVILDLNLPVRDGFEVLEHLKGRPNLRTIPVVILTVSSAQRDVWRGYNSFANAYMVKPTDVHDFMTALGRLAAFYLRTVQLPPPREATGRSA